MLQACRVLSPVRGLVSFRQSVIYRVSVSPLSTSCMVLQTTDMQDQLGNIKPQERLGNVKPEQIFKDKKVISGAISMEGFKGFEELKARVIKLRITQLDLLKQKLGDDFMVENPVDILPSVPKKSFSCGKCGKTYKTKANLMRHEGTACGSIKQEEVLAPRPVVEHKCEGCGKIYKHESGLTKHKKTSLTCSSSQGEKEFEKLKARVIELKIAQSNFSKQKLADDFMVENSVDILPSVPKKPFSCGKCGKTYKNKANLMRHEGTDCGSIKQVEVSAPRPVIEHKCIGCGKIYKHESSLTKHLKMTCSASLGNVKPE